jgi:hypothetical protein
MGDRLNEFAAVEWGLLLGMDCFLLLAKRQFNYSLCE